MSKVIYPKLGFEGIKKNEKLYIPYIFTCAFVIAAFYILSFLSASNVVRVMSGGNQTTLITGLGSVVVAIFSIIFLFYTGSFLVKRRKKEFGLLNVLGMNKKNLCRILFFETLYTYLISMGIGLFVGVVLSKLAELILCNLVNVNVNFNMSIDVASIIKTAILFTVVFGLIMLNTVRQIIFSKPIELVKSENLGEKPPKANWVLGILGIIILGIAYYLAVSIKHPLSAFTVFFAAVVMVIVGTYFIFIAVSVIVCKILQKTKKFYYKKQNFFAISSMAFRMKRNGAGLASICVLLTMVVVLISATASLFFGADDALRNRYPKEIDLVAAGYIDEYTEESDESGFVKYDYNESTYNTINQIVDEACAEYNVSRKNELIYTEYSIVGMLNDGHVKLTPNSIADMSINVYDKLCEIHFISLDDYNRIFNKNETLEQGQVLASYVKLKNVTDVIEIGGMEFTIVKRVMDIQGVLEGADMTSVVSGLFLVTDNMEEVADTIGILKDSYGDSMLMWRMVYQFDIDGPANASVEIGRSIDKSLSYVRDANNLFNTYCDSRIAQKSDFVDLFGALLFVGLLLSFVFMIGAVLIIYYKQISEGYEDQSRFEIMQKVGMTDKDIRQTINSQMMMIFLLPIIFAAIHCAFAFPFIYKILMLFGLYNTGLLIRVFVLVILGAAILYAIVYKITSNAYYKIVKTATR